MSATATTTIGFVAIGWACFAALVLLLLLAILRVAKRADRLADLALGTRQLDADRDAHYRACDSYARNGHDQWAADLDNIWRAA